MDYKMCKKKKKVIQHFAEEKCEIWNKCGALKTLMTLTANELYHVVKCCTDGSNIGIYCMLVIWS